MCKKIRCKIFNVNLCNVIILINLFVNLVSVFHCLVTTYIRALHLFINYLHNKHTKKIKQHLC